MKIHQLYIGLIGLIWMFSCDIIDEDDRIIQTDELNFTNKVVLLEDYTGHKCQNCPLADEEIERLKDWCGEHVVVVSIHAGNYANANGSAWETNFRTEAGEAYHTYFKPDGYPAGVIDRVSIDGQITHSNLSLWATHLVSRLGEKSAFEIRLTSAYSTSKEEIEVSVLIESEENIEQPISLQVWMIENGIISPQLMPDNTINYNYSHHHVLRKTINGIWGEEMNKNGFMKENKKKFYTFTPATNWKIENCQIVAFVFDTESREVFQTVQSGIEIIE